MATAQTGIIKKVSVSFALLILATILLLISWRTTHSVPVLAVVIAWCLFGILLPGILLRRKIRSGAVKPPGRRLLAGMWSGLAVYMLVLAVFEIVTGAGFTDWGFTLLAAVACIVTAIMTR